MARNRRVARLQVRRVVRYGVAQDARGRVRWVVRTRMDGVGHVVRHGMRRVARVVDGRVVRQEVTRVARRRMAAGVVDRCEVRVIRSRVGGVTGETRHGMVRRLVTRVVRGCKT